MQLRNEWNKTPLLLKFFNFVFLALLWLCDFAVLGLRPWRAQKALLGILRRVLGRGREIPHSPQLAHKSSITLATQAAGRLNEQSRDWLVHIYPFVSYYSGEAPSEGFATLRNVPELRTRVWAILSARAQVSRAKGDVNTWQILLGVWVHLGLTEPLWWRCNNLSQANPPFNGYQKK